MTNDRSDRRVGIVRIDTGLPWGPPRRPDLAGVATGLAAGGHARRADAGGVDTARAAGVSIRLAGLGRSRMVRTAGAACGGIAWPARVIPMVGITRRLRVGAHGRRRTTARRRRTTGGGMSGVDRWRPGVGRFPWPIV